MIKLKIKYRNYPGKKQEIICAIFWTTNSMGIFHYKTSLDSNIEHVIIIADLDCDVFIEATNVLDKEGGC